MGIVKIEPNVLNDMANYISDIKQRTQLNISDTRQKGEQVLRQILNEVVKRQRRVEELTRQYDYCCRDSKADCSELRRQLIKAQQSLEVALRAQKRSSEALVEYKVKANVINEQMGSFSVAGKNTISKLKKNLDDYSAFSVLVAASILGTDYTAQAMRKNNSTIARKLSRTNQSYSSVKAGNRDTLVFDHPQKSANNAVINQGTANPTGFKGTCGLCATGSVIRKAGINVSEWDMIAYASDNGLCTTGKSPEHNGGTNSNQLISILEGLAGICAQNDVGKSLEELATLVENGQGVIIGVNPSLINTSWYGDYNPNDNGGHWVVLESVIRDAKTNDILGYVIFDSNGNSPAETCQTIKASQLQNAYYTDGAVSVTTDDIIW